MAVRTECQYTLADEFFAKTNSFVFTVENGRADLGNVTECGETKPVVGVEVVNFGGELIEVAYLEDGSTRMGRRRPVTENNK